MNVNDFEVDAKRNLEVILVDASLAIATDYSQYNRLGMLGVIDTEHMSR